MADFSIIKNLLQRLHNAARKYPQIRESCRLHSELLESNQNRHTSRIGSADYYFEPFRLACETQNKEIAEVALMSITQLISGSYLTGELMLEISKDENDTNNENNNDSAENTPTDMKDDSHNLNNHSQQSHNNSNKKRRRDSQQHRTRPPKLIDIIIKTVCSCINIVSLHLPLLRCLLALSTSQHCEIHGDNFKTLILTSYFIDVDTKNQNVHTAALGTLNQALAVLFEKVEEKHRDLSRLHEAYGKIETREQQLKFESQAATQTLSSSNSHSHSQSQSESMTQSSSPHKNGILDEKDGKNDNNDNNHHNNENESSVVETESDCENIHEFDEKTNNNKNSDKNNDKTDDEYVVVSHATTNNENNSDNINETDSKEIIESILTDLIDQVVSNVDNENENESELKENWKKEYDDNDATSVCSAILQDVIDQSVEMHLEKMADVQKKIGNQMYSRNQLNDAIFYYKRAHSIFPQSPVYLVNQGVAFYSLKDFDSCEKVCMDALLIGTKAQCSEKYKSFNAKAYSIMAHVSYQRSNIVECMRYYRLSLRCVFDKKISEKVKEISKKFDIQLQDDNDFGFWQHKVHLYETGGDVHGPSGVETNSDKQQLLQDIKHTSRQLVKLQEDAFGILDEFCRLTARKKLDKKYISSSQLNFLAGKHDMENRSIKSRELSLLLWHASLQQIGPSVSDTKQFIDQVRDKMVPTLCANVTSTIQNVVRGTMDIFRTLVKRLKHTVIAELGVLFDSFLTFAVSNNSTFSQKLEILKALSDICSDGNTNVAMFLNYDCSDSGAADSTITSVHAQLQKPRVFQKIISTIEIMGQSKLESRDWINEDEANALRDAALLCFKRIMDSLVIWKDNAMKRQQSHSNIRRNSSSGFNGGNMVRMNREDSLSANEREDVVETTNDLDTANMTNNTSSIPPPPPPLALSNTASNSSANAVDSLFSMGSGNEMSFHEKYQRSKKKEKTLKNGIVRFNMKPSNGIKFLTGNKLLENNSKAIAHFLLNQKGLSKVQIGEYLGGEKAMNIEVMHEFIDSLSFTGMEFVDALRYLCSIFMLPPEGQKIDRILERFAQRYTELNPEVFESGDVAYILSYSIILLHVNIHNAKVKRKMTKEEFINSNKSATKEEEQELSPALLSSIYDNIVAKEMKLQDDGMSEFGEKRKEPTSIKEKMEALRQNSRLLVRDAKKKMRMAKKFGNLVDEKYLSPEEADPTVCHLMFSASWYAALATFSLVLETSNYTRHVESALSGFRSCIRLASELDMHVECTAFVNSLARFTLLGTLEPMKEKNILAIKTLLDIAYKEGNNLRESWVHILRCISEIEVLYLMASNAISDIELYGGDQPNVSYVAAQQAQQQQQQQSHHMRDDSQSYQDGMEERETSVSHNMENNSVSAPMSHNNHPNGNNSHPSLMSPGFKSNQEMGDSSMSVANDSESKLISASTHSVAATGQANHEHKMVRARTHMGKDGVLRFQHDHNAKLVAKEIDQTLISKIFANSSKLDSQAIVHFVKHLCGVSKQELSSAANPRVFCLQKIVEISTFNMDDRVRFVWLTIWKVLADHFCFAGLHPNSRISMYAVDSLRQLADKFLEKDELSSFNFQKEFMKPFLTVIKMTLSEDIKELIVQCMQRLILSRFSNIRSGWKLVFAVLGVAARAENEHLADITYSVMLSILDLYFPKIQQISTRMVSSENLTHHNVAHNNINNNFSSNNSSNGIISSHGNEAKSDITEIMEERVKQLKLIRIDALTDCVDTLIAFVHNSLPNLSMSAIDDLSKISQYLFECDTYLPDNMFSSNAIQQQQQSRMFESEIMHNSNVSSLVGKHDDTLGMLSNSLSGGTPDLSRPLIKAWFLCLLGLSRGVNDSRLEVRTHSLGVFFRLLRVQGTVFDEIMWRRVFERLLLPIFAELRQVSNNSNVDLMNDNIMNNNNNNQGRQSLTTDDVECITPRNAKTTHLRVQTSSFDGKRRSSTEDIVNNKNEENNESEMDTKNNMNENEIEHQDSITTEKKDDNGSPSPVVAMSRKRRSNSITLAPSSVRGTSDTRLPFMGSGTGGHGTDSHSEKNNLYDDFGWIETTLHTALSRVIELFHQYFYICQPLLHDVTSVCTSFISLKTSLDASQIGQQCLQRLLHVVGPKLSNNQWAILINDLIYALKRSYPTQLNSHKVKSYFGMMIAKQREKEAKEEMLAREERKRKKKRRKSASIESQQNDTNSSTLSPQQQQQHQQQQSNQQLDQSRNLKDNDKSLVSQNGLFSGTTNNVPKNVMNVDAAFVACDAVIACLQQLLQIGTKHLSKLTFQQCVDILNAFHHCFEFIVSITKDIELMDCFEHLVPSNAIQAKLDLLRLARYLYKIEGLSMEASLLVLFECKYVRFANNNNNFSNNVITTTSASINSALAANIDENVKSQILEATENGLSLNVTPPPVPLLGEMEISNPTENGDYLDSENKNEESKMNDDNISKRKMEQLEEIRMALSNSNVQQLSELRLIPLGIELMQLIYQRERRQNRHGHDVEYLSPVVVSFLKHLASVNDFNDSQFNNKIHILFPYLTKLIECDSVELRSIISSIFAQRVQKCLIQFRAMSQPVSPRLSNRESPRDIITPNAIDMNRRQQGTKQNRRKVSNNKLLNRKSIDSSEKDRNMNGIKNDDSNDINDLNKNSDVPVYSTDDMRTDDDDGDVDQQDTEHVLMEDEIVD